jgi:glycosyltransferase involved in cell wall biosynthesis
LKANLVYSDLNPCGGGERLTLATMQALAEMDIDIELTTLQKPDIIRLENAFGKRLASVIENIKKINILDAWEEQSIIDNISGKDYDLVINTHGDIAPYYHKSISKDNAITYCHFPSAKSFIESEDKAYFEKHIVARGADAFTPARPRYADSSSVIAATAYEDPLTDKAHLGKNINSKRQRYIKWLKEAYKNLMKNSTLLTNSEYSRKAIFNMYGIDDAIVISPPVDVEMFRNEVLSSKSHGKVEGEEEIILVTCRIDPLKKIDNALRLAELLKASNIGNGMRIVGSLEAYYYDYYLHLKKMAKDLNLTDYITLEVNVSLDKLLSLMRKSSIYFHPKPAEHFGMSIVEAMSAGLVPIVSDVGGQTEFVPSQYQFHTLEDAAKIVSSAFDAPFSERAAISDSVTRFSASNYIKCFKQLLVSHV